MLDPPGVSLGRPASAGSAVLRNEESWGQGASTGQMVPPVPIQGTLHSAVPHVTC